jgi:hypothetical protein
MGKPLLDAMQGERPIESAAYAPSAPFHRPPGRAAAGCATVTLTSLDPHSARWDFFMA